MNEAKRLDGKTRIRLALLFMRLAGWMLCKRVDVKYDKPNAPDRPSSVRSDLWDAVMGEWHDVRSAPPGPDYHDGWNAALLCVAEILKASNVLCGGSNDGN